MHSESRWSGRFGAAATVVLLTTVCLLPWIHGGNIPLARLVLQIGAVAAAALSLVSCLLRSERSGYPAIIFPLAVLSAVGVIQLMPLHAPIISQMNHAVYADLRPAFTGGGTGPLAVRTASPGDTRLIVAQLLALTLLAMAAFDQLRERRAVLWCLTAFTLNASLLSVLSFAQLFQDDLFLIRSEWWTGMGHPFGTFVNPNNAAGWLVMGVASAVGLLAVQVDDSDGHRGSHGQHGLASSGGVDALVRYFARLNAMQILAWLSLAVIASAMLATRSRTGMVASGVAFAFTMLVRIRKDRLGLSVVVAAAGLVGVTALVFLLNLQESIFDELRTLQDPLGQLAGRITHWRDSASAILDFPVFGAGLGAYRYATLPYQAHSTGFWFQNADNQYVEVLVEAGVVGFLAFILLGLPISIRAVRIIRRSVAGGLGPSAEAVAFVLLFVTVAQGVAALADYGAILPSTSAMFVTLVSMLAAIQAEARSDRLLPPNRAVTAGMRIALIVGALMFTIDLMRAHDCYLVVIEAEKVAREPLSWETMERRQDILERAAGVLENRGDDPRTHEVVSRLLRDTTRSKFLQGIPGFEDQESFEKAWPYTAVFMISRRIDSIDDAARQDYLSSVLEARTRQSGLLEHCQETLVRMPLLAPVVRRAARWSMAAGIEDPGERLAQRARFNEPTNGTLSVQLGELAMRAGDDETAVEIWQRALRLDESQRCWILSSYASQGRMEEGFEVFGPGVFSEAVIALRKSPNREVWLRIVDTAEQLWAEPETEPSKEIQDYRYEYLLKTGRITELIDWLKRCVEWSPNDVKFHRELARFLFDRGRLRESQAAWNEVLKVDRFDKTAEQEISRIQIRLNAREKAQE